MNEKRRIRQLQRRIDHLEEALATYDDVSRDEGLKGRVVRWLLPKLEAAGIDVDQDDNQAISTDEFKDALDEVAEWIDKRIPLPEPFETMMDLGSVVVAELIVGVVFKSKSRLERRLARKKARLAKVKAKL